MVSNLSPRVLEVNPVIRTDLVLALLFIVSLLAGVWPSDWTFFLLLITININSTRLIHATEYFLSEFLDFWYRCYYSNTLRD